MGFNGYIQLGDIKGESTDDKHKDWVEIISISNLHPVQAPPLPKSSAAGSASSSGNKSSFSVTKLVDKASPKLYEALHNGTHIPKVIIELYRPTGSSKQKYLTIKMNQVLIASVSAPRQSPQASQPGTVVAPVLLTESVSFNYGNIEWEYT